MMDQNNSAGSVSTKQELCFPATPMQQYYVSVQKTWPNASATHLAMRWKLSFDLSDTDFHRIIAFIVERHDALRTRFGNSDGSLTQLVGDGRVHARVAQLAADLSDGDDALEVFCREEASAPFDVFNGPLCRFCLIRLPGASTVLLATFHLSISDGWSAGIFARDFATLANSVAHNRELRLPEVDIQYPDFALWQEEYLASEGARKSSTYWKDKLRGVRRFEVPFPLTQRPIQQTCNGGLFSIVLGRDETDEFSLAAGRSGLSLFSLCAASLATVLGRLAGTTDVPVLTSVANREETLIGSTFGPVFNSVILRFNTSFAADLGRYLTQSRALIAEAFTHKDLPISDALATVTGDWTLGRYASPMGVHVAVHQATLGASRPGVVKEGVVQLTALPSVNVGTVYDLNFFMIERESLGWRASCEFNSDVFDQKCVADLLEQWRSEMRRVAKFLVNDISSLETGPTILSPRRYFRTIPLVRGGDLPPVFAFNNASAYYPVARHFEGRRPFIDIQWLQDAKLPALSSESIAEIAADAARCVKEYDPTGPYYLLGHCMIGIVAFDAARQIVASGGAVPALFLLNTIAPGYIEKMPLHDRLWRRFVLSLTSADNAVVLAKYVRGGSMKPREAIMQYRLVRDFLAWFGVERKSLYGNDLIGRGLLNFLTDAKKLYNASVFDGNAFFFRSADARVGRLFARDFGWDRLIGGKFRVYDVPGKHLEMSRDPGATVIAEHMAWIMDQIEGRWHFSGEKLNDEI